MFQGKNFAVIGASSGIGLEIARQLSAAGAVVHAYSRRPLPESLPNAVWQPADVTAPDFSLPQLPDELHGLVYAPGTILLKPMARISVEDFRRDLEVNVVGAFRSLQQAHKPLRATGAGSVVLFSSVVVQTGMNLHASIGSAKGAVEGLVRALAAEWAPLVRVNAIAPSLTDTPLATALLNSEEKRQLSANRHPMRKIGSPADMAAIACFLLSEAAGFVTGQIIHVDGGMGALR